MSRGIVRIHFFFSFIIAFCSQIFRFPFEMYSETRRIFFLCAVLFIANTHAIPKRKPLSICNSDEIGIGSSEKLVISNGGASIRGDGYQGAIYAHNCEILDLSTNETPFDGGWDDYYSVSSIKIDDYVTGTFPLEVRTPNGIYKNCMVLDGHRNCDSDGEDYHLLSPVTHCCKYSGPNNEVQKRQVEKSRAKTICNPDEVGVGRILIDKYISPSSVESDGHQGAIFAHDCQILDLSQYATPWEGGWDKYFNILNTNYGQGPFPTEVRTPDGIYQRCMQLPITRNCDGEGQGYFLEAPITHCCKYIRPNPDVPQKAASIENIEDDNTEIDGGLPTDSVDT